MPDLRDIPADIDQLQVGDWIAFAWDYNGGVRNGDPLKKGIEIARVSYIREQKLFSVGFVYGHRSVDEDVLREDIIAIGSSSGKDKIKLWNGPVHIINPEHPTLLKWQEDYKDRS